MAENAPIALGAYVHTNTTGVSGATQYLQPNVIISNVGTVNTVDPRLYSPGIIVGTDGAEKA